MSTDKHKAYMKAWHLANPLTEEQKEVARARTRAWSLANPLTDEQKERRAERARTPESRENNTTRSKAWYAANRTRANASARSWAIANPDKVAEYDARYDKANPHKRRAKVANRKATKIRATPQWANTFFIAEAYQLAVLREKTCGGKWHVDHIVPLISGIVCGLHCEFNLQVIPGKENTSKGNRYWPDMP